MKLQNIAIVTMILVSGCIAAVAQDNVAQPEAARPTAEGPHERGRPNLLRELGLTREQLQQIRQMNIERRPQMITAQKAMRDAIGALDKAIYADSTNDDEVAARIKDFQAAQAEISRLRFNSELSVRKILTPEQLVRFKELRRRFEGNDENFPRRRRGRGLRPFQINKQNPPSKADL